MISGELSQSTIRTKKNRKHRFWLALILILFLLVTCAYGAINPLFEAPDEQFHYYTVELIRESEKIDKNAAQPDMQQPFHLQSVIGKAAG